MPEKTYLLPIWDTIATAWTKMAGSKGTILASFIVSCLITLGCFIGKFIILAYLPFLDGIVSIAIHIINTLLFSGVLYIGIRHIANLPITFDMMFQTFDARVALRIIIYMILEVLLLCIPFIVFIIAMLIFVLPSIIFSFLSFILGLIGVILFFFIYYRTSPAMGFILDQQQGPWQAIKSAYHVTRHNVLRLLLIHIISIFIFAISIIPFGIGLIWTIPFLYNLYGVFYKRLLLNQSVEVATVTVP